MALYIPHSIFHLARLLYVRPETFGPYYVHWKHTWGKNSIMTPVQCIFIIYNSTKFCKLLIILLHIIIYDLLLHVSKLIRHLQGAFCAWQYRYIGRKSYCMHYKRLGRINIMKLIFRNIPYLDIWKLCHVYVWSSMHVTCSSHTE